MNMIMKEQRDFYSSVDWLFWSKFELENLPSDFDELVDYVSMFDRLALAKLEREYEHGLRWKRRAKAVLRFISSAMSLIIPKDEFNGRYRK